MTQANATRRGEGRSGPQARGAALVFVLGLVACGNAAPLGGFEGPGAGGAPGGPGPLGGDIGQNPGLRFGPQPDFGPTVTAEKTPPALSGGTLRLSRSGDRVFVSDPDRDLVSIVDLSLSLDQPKLHAFSLREGDEPGRLVEGSDGKVHVALRRGGAVATIDVARETITRREVCPSPRGLAFDEGTAKLYVACEDGTLVTVAADGSTSSVKLERGLRDVVIAGERVLISKLRSSELLACDKSGRPLGRTRAPSVMGRLLREGAPFESTIAWRTSLGPSGQVVMLHERATTGAVVTGTPGGYGGQDCSSTIVHTAITSFDPTTLAPLTTTLPFARAVLPIDVAYLADTDQYAVIAAGNAHTPELPTLFLVAAKDAVPATSLGNQPLVLTAFDGLSSGTEGAPQPTPAAGLPGCLDDSAVPVATTGEPVAVVYSGVLGVLIVQSRQPAELRFYLPSGAELAQVSLPGRDTTDTGHAVFHSNAGASIACASCHAEGAEDGHVWRFAETGPRRTQSLRGGVRGTEPFHWDGDMRDLDMIMEKVFVGRMSGPVLGADQKDAVANYLERALPVASPALVVDSAAVQRGKTLFYDAKKTACATCHEGARLTNNQTVDVGTGGAFQVPSLVGVGWRTPLMHDGCAATLADRFDPACGGATHGLTSTLTAQDKADLVAYLENL